MAIGDIGYYLHIGDFIESSKYVFLGEVVEEGLVVDLGHIDTGEQCELGHDEYVVETEDHELWYHRPHVLGPYTVEQARNLQDIADKINGLVAHIEAANMDLKHFGEQLDSKAEEWL